MNKMRALTCINDPECLDSKFKNGGSIVLSGSPFNAFDKQAEVG